MALKKSLNCYTQKTYFLLPDHQPAEDLILVFGLKIKTKRG